MNLFIFDILHEISCDFSRYLLCFALILVPFSEQEMEVLLRAGEKSCVIHKCYPGSNHYIRIHAISNDGTILDRSKQLVVQTSAPPDTPTVTLRCVCLHRCQQFHNRVGIPAIPHFCETSNSFCFISKKKKIVIIFWAANIFCGQKLKLLTLILTLGMDRF